jgi:hypothetical protein
VKLSERLAKGSRICQVSGLTKRAVQAKSISSLTYEGDGLDFNEY